MGDVLGDGCAATRSRPADQAPAGLAASRVDQARDLDDAYQCVHEALEYFDSHRLATWAPVASLFMRERRRGRVEGISGAPSLFAALDLAANRLLACAINAGGSRESSEYSQWAKEARQAAELVRDSDGVRSTETQAPVPQDRQARGEAIANPNSGDLS